MSEREPPGPDQDQWVTRAVAERILGVNSKAFGRLVSTGRLTMLTPPPGVTGHTKYSRPELQQLRDSMVKPATTA